MRGASRLSVAALSFLCCAVAASSPIRLTDDPTDWRVVNDGVMGGMSTSRVVRAGEALRFAGEISLANNGGFASIRRPFDAGGADAAGLLLRVRGDGNRYRLRVYTRDATGGENGYSHYATFDTRAGEVSSVELRWRQFAASFRGRAVDAPPIRFADVTGIGVMITRDDHRDGRGSFSIDLLGIEPLR
jgi:monofunctional biosynthetic peptidoglycan transglycosylase